MYTTDDVAGVVEYARSRGVRTVFEVDHPGHLSSACKGYPNLCPASCAWDAGDNAVPLAPADNGTWAMLRDTLTELAALSPDAFLHLGGDEVRRGVCVLVTQVMRSFRVLSSRLAVGPVACRLCS